MSKERVAVLDIGSNSVRLMVADLLEEGGFCTLGKTLRTTRLAEGMVESGRIGRAAMDRTLAGIQELLLYAREQGADRSMCFATAAVRSAANRDDFICRLHHETRILVRVLTGEEEAQASFLGAGAQGRHGLIDLGGASTELVTGENDRIDSAVSLPMGAVAALERYPLGNPPDSLCLQAMGEWVRCVLKDADPLRGLCREKGVLQWICVGGTVTTLAAMDLHLDEYDDARVDGHPLARQTLMKQRDMLVAMTLEERRHVPGLDPKRADIILGGITILLGVMEYFNMLGLRVSTGDNLEGFLRMKLLHEQGKEEK